MFIKANDEAEAIRYYNNHFKNTHFDFPNYRKINENGRCTRGKIVETYFATGIVFDADATIETTKEPKNIDEIIADATIVSKGQMENEKLPNATMEKE